MKFCFVCGKNTEKLVDGYCEDCYNKKFKLISAPKSITVKTCSKCGRISHANAWREMEIGDLLRDKIKIHGKNVNIRITKTDDGFSVKAKGFLEGSRKEKTEICDIRIKSNKVVCLDCSRRLGDYYEAILQIRGNVDKAMEFIMDQLDAQKSIYKIEKAGGGIDIYLDDSHIASTISKNLKHKFRAKVKRSFKLYTRKQGKDIYRSTIVVRI